MGHAAAPVLFVCFDDLANDPAEIARRVLEFYKL